jgi:hypothetical protein
MDICPGQLAAVKCWKFNESKFSVTQLPRGVITGTDCEGWVGVGMFDGCAMGEFDGVANGLFVG